MSLLRGDDQLIPAPFTFHSHPDNIVRLSSTLWVELSGSSEDRIGISVIFPQFKTCSWAIQDTYLSHDHPLAIPSSWKHEIWYSSCAVVHLTRAQPVHLTDVIVSAISSDAYDMAISNENTVLARLSQDRQILRQGATYSITAESTSSNKSQSNHLDQYGFLVEHCEPVVQGYANEATRFIVLRETPEADDDFHDDDSSVAGTEDIDINEEFLAGSISSGLEIAHSFQNFQSPHPASVTLRAASIRLSPSKFLELLQSDTSIGLRAAELARLGAQDGDWSESELGMRLAQVFVNNDAPSACALASSTLFHNIARDVTQKRLLTLVSSPFGSTTPPIPTAKSITIARIASPISTQKRYQSNFLSALKNYFDGFKRLVKSGDILALSVSLPFSHIDDELEYEMEESSKDMVFFIVTHIDTIGPSQQHAPAHNMVDAGYDGAIAGELGCWVDTSITKIVQAGLEHSRIPSQTETSSMWSNFDMVLKINITSAISDELGGAPAKLLAFVGATLLPQSQKLQLDTTLLISGPRGVGKFTAISNTSRMLGIQLVEINLFNIINDTAIRTEGSLRARFDQAKDCCPCIIVLRHLDALTQTTQGLEPGKELPLASVLSECLQDLQGKWNATGFPVVVTGTTSIPEKIPQELLNHFKHNIKFEVPGEEERLRILESLTTAIPLGNDVSLRNLATQTAALVAADLVSLVSRAEITAITRVQASCDANERDLYFAGSSIIAADFDIALGQARTAYSESIGAPKIPNVTWDDVGGLAHVKMDILDTIQLPLEHPELFSDGLKKRSGILLYGPPGTGKTLLAKAVATSCSLNFFSVKGPELINMYIGESEANVRRVFQRARDARPCVIFFDELDSIAPKRGNTGDSGGVMDRIVSQLLAELDGMSTSSGSDVFVIGATNRPDLLDPALLRPGRFDRLLYLGVSETKRDRLNILEALTRKFKLHPDLSLDQLAERCPSNYTGADYYALCSDAMLNAMSRKAEEIEKHLALLNAHPSEMDRRHPYPLTPQYYLSEMASPTEIEVLVTWEDFIVALNNLRPSVSANEMQHYKTIQERFKSEGSKTSTKGKAKAEG
ncbi:AAA-domain-containing protein [Flagelloscypha sp. PMI_526]|nr:AAA-domain-containing protein [Flagelloscypha sp. PMI_526]